MTIFVLFSMMVQNNGAAKPSETEQIEALNDQHRQLTN